MNKLAQGAIAGTAGIALLLGGAGTFALWNDSASVDGSTVTSGTLSIEALGDGSWTDITGGASEDVIDIDSFLVVPGNTLQFVQQFTIAATGNDLEAELEFDPASITGGLEPFVETTLVVTGPTNVVATADDNVYTITPGVAGTFVVNVVFTVELPSSVDGTDGQDESLDLSDLDFTLTQLAI